MPCRWTFFRGCRRGQVCGHAVRDDHAYCKFHSSLVERNRNGLYVPRWVNYINLTVEDSNLHHKYVNKNAYEEYRYAIEEGESEDVDINMEDDPYVAYDCFRDELDPSTLNMPETGCRYKIKEGRLRGVYCACPIVAQSDYCQFHNSVVDGYNSSKNPVPIWTQAIKPTVNDSCLTMQELNWRKYDIEHLLFFDLMTMDRKFANVKGSGHGKTKACSNKTTVSAVDEPSMSSLDDAHNNTTSRTENSFPALHLQRDTMNTSCRNEIPSIPCIPKITPSLPIIFEDSNNQYIPQIPVVSSQVNPSGIPQVPLPKVETNNQYLPQIPAVSSHVKQAEIPQVPSPKVETNRSPSPSLTVTIWDQDRGLYREVYNNFIVRQVSPGTIAVVGVIDLDTHQARLLLESEKRIAREIGCVIDDTYLEKK